MQDESITIQSLDTVEAIHASALWGHLFYHPHWLQVLLQQYGYCFWVTQGPPGEYMLFAMTQGLLGNKLVSLPFSDYTLPQVPAHRLALHLEALQTRFPTVPILLKCADLYASPHELAFLGEPLAKAYLHRVQLQGNPEEHMSTSFLRGVRKARKNKLVAVASRSQASLEQFYALYYRLRTEKLGLIPQPFTFFQQVFEQFIQTGEGFFFEVKQKNEVLASAIILQEGEGIYYKWGCSAQDRLILRPNNLLFRELIAMFANTDYRYLDLGLSDVDETRGLVRFKESIGGKPSFIYTYCLYPKGYPRVLEKKLKGLLNQVAGTVVRHKLGSVQTQAFSQALYPLFV